MDKTLMIKEGRTALGIEFGSTRVKAVLIGDDFVPLASGGYEWENKLEGGYWTYSLDEVHTALRSSFKALKADVKEKYGCDFVTTGAIGISGMMHGYLAFDKNGKLLVYLLQCRTVFVCIAIPVSIFAIAATFSHSRLAV